MKDCSKNIAVCLENSELIDKIKGDDCNIFDCSDNWYKVKKKIYEDDKCIDNCTITNYKFEYKYKCYSNCQDGHIIIIIFVKIVMKIVWHVMDHIH